MILIPQETVQRLQGDKTDVTALDKEMSTILKNNKLSDADKWKLYDQALQRFLHVTDQRRKTIKIGMKTTEKEEDGSFQDLVVTTVPKKFQRKAMTLYDKLASNPQLSWSQNGEVTIKGTKIPTFSHC